MENTLVCATNRARWEWSAYQTADGEIAEKREGNSEIETETEREKIVPKWHETPSWELNAFSPGKEI